MPYDPPGLDAAADQIRDPLHALANLSQEEFSRGFILAALASGRPIREDVLEALHKQAAQLHADASFFSLLFKGEIVPGLEDGELTWQLAEAAVRLHAPERGA